MAEDTEKKEFILPAGSRIELAPPQGPSGSAAEREEQVGEVHLIYKIEGQPNEIPLFELARTLQSVGLVIQEANRIVGTSPHDVVVKVRPFEKGSFFMDLMLSVQNNPAVIFFLTNPEAYKQIKTVLEYIGLIKKGKEAIQTVKDVVDFLKGNKPEKVERQPNGTVTFTGPNGTQLNVPGPVGNLYVNPVITNNYFYAFGGNGMNRDGVEGLITFLKDQEEQTKQFVSKEEVVKTLKSYSEPLPAPPKVESVVNETVQYLNPKEGTYGSAEGVTFLPAGKKRGGFKARIADENFLSRFHSGQVRFFQNDLLKARVKSEQKLSNGKTSSRHEIVEVLNYDPAPTQGFTG